MEDVKSLSVQRALLQDSLPQVGSVEVNTYMMSSFVHHCLYSTCLFLTVRLTITSTCFSCDDDRKEPPASSTTGSAQVNYLHATYIAHDYLYQVCLFLMVSLIVTSAWFTCD
jgi:hypothetical protein